MPGAGKLVDYKQHVAHVQGNVAHPVGVVHDVRHGAFPVAVEVGANQLAATVDDGRAGVAASGVVGSGEGYGHGAVHGVGAVVLFLVQLQQARRYLKLGVVGVGLLHDAVEGGVVVVVHAVGGLVTRYLPVGHAQGRVGVGVELASGLPLAQGGHVAALQQGDVVGCGLVSGLNLGAQGVLHGAGQLVGRVSS